MMDLRSFYYLLFQEVSLGSMDFKKRINIKLGRKVSVPFKHFRRLCFEMSYTLQNTMKKKEREMLLLVQWLRTAIEHLLK